MGIINRALDWGLKGSVFNPDDREWTLSTIKVKELLARKPLNFWVVLFLGTSQILGVSALFQPFSWLYLPIMVGMYLWLGFSVTFYLHRYLTHRGLELAGWLKPVFAIGSVVGLNGDPVGWVGDHRHHHRASDKENDLHSPRQLGFWTAHWGWIFRDLTDFSAKTRLLANDVRQEHVLHRWFESPALMIAPHLLVAATLWATMGFAGMVWCFYFPLFVMNHVTWAINSVCHVRRLGYQNYPDAGDDSVNVPLMGLMALGEGWHNNHHANARRAAHGLKWWEFDATKILIWGFERLGWAKKVVW